MPGLVIQAGFFIGVVRIEMGFFVSPS